MTRTLTQGIGGLVGILVTLALLVGCGGGGGDGNQLRLVEEQLAAEETARRAAEQKAAAEAAAKLAAEQEAAAAEAARLLAEQKASEEEAARLEAERAAAEEKARLEAERAAAEQENLRLQLAALSAELQAAQEEGEEEPATDDQPDPGQSSSSSALLGGTGTTDTDDTATTTDDDTHPGLSALLGGTGTTDTSTTTTTTTTTTITPQPQQQQQSQTLEATNRGEGVLKALEALGTAPRIPTAAFVGTTTKTFKIQANPLTGTTSGRAADGTRRATLTQTLAGDKEQFVVYTDREETRTFANQFGAQIIDRNAAKLRFTLPTAWDLTNVLANRQGVVTMTSSQLGTLEAFDDSGGVNTDADRTGTRKTVSAFVLGVPGVFGCDTSGTACDVTVTASYTRAPTVLTGITLAPASGGTLYFQPTNSARTIKLDGSLNYPLSTALTDTEYGVWGYWQETPESADVNPKIAVFAQANHSAEFAVGDAVGTAQYQGPAVGVYAEQLNREINVGGVRKMAVQSGEFTATAILRATFGGTPEVSGTITGFKTDHGTKTWRINLGSALDNARFQLPTGTDLGDTHTGSWTRTFLGRHTTSQAANTGDQADDQPIAAVGTFNVEIQNVRHVVGAFGVRRTTGPHVP